MRKLGLAAALAAAVLFAQGARADDAAEHAKDRADRIGERTKDRADELGDKTKHQANDAKDELGDASQRAKANAKRAGNAASDEAHDAATAANRKGHEAKQSANRALDRQHPLFSGKDNYDVDGKIAKVSHDSITISREGLPPAQLKISDRTKIQLDGDRASAKQLEQGADVKASFNLNEDKPEAVEIDAKRTDAQEKAHERREDMNRSDKSKANGK